jgi:excinuclease UvrABC ATPase subunit
LYSHFEVDKKSWKKSFPSNEVHLSRRLNKIKENLANQGITFESHGREKTFHVIGVYDSQKDKEYREAKEAAQAQLSEYSSAHECNTCGFYQGNDYCSQTDSLADPDNCPLENIGAGCSPETTPAVC